MSYSRWSNSQWYTYRRSRDRNGSTHRRGQVFCIFSIIDFTAGEICNDIESCLDTAIDKYLSEQKQPQCASDARKELREYMVHFISDINKERNLQGNKLHIR